MKNKVKYIEDNNGLYTIKEYKNIITYTFNTREGRFIGRSTCAPEDKFDEWTGMRIAKLRAILAMKKHMLNILRLDKDTANIYLSNRSYEAVRSHFEESMNVLRTSIRNIKFKIKGTIDTSLSKDNTMNEKV